MHFIFLLAWTLNRLLHLNQSPPDLVNLEFLKLKHSFLSRSSTIYFLTYGTFQYYYPFFNFFTKATYVWNENYILDRHQCLSHAEWICSKSAATFSVACFIVATLWPTAAPMMWLDYIYYVTKKQTKVKPKTYAMVLEMLMCVHLMSIICQIYDYTFLAVMILSTANS